MRSFIISLVAILLTIVSWIGFMFYCENSIDELSNHLEQQVILEIEKGNWEAAEKKLETFTTQWHRHRKIYSFFLDSNTLLETDFSIGRAEAYIKSRDNPLALGELSQIYEQLKALYSNEKITLENIM